MTADREADRGPDREPDREGNPEADPGTAAERALRLVPVTGSATEWTESLVADAGLPTEDLEEAALWVAVDTDGGRVGCGGIEPRGEVGLLRSVVVHPKRRDEGHGRALVRALERRAREVGIDRLYLLTTDAAGFFETLGYERGDRESVPEGIEETRQFAELCPTSAAVMRNDL